MKKLKTIENFFKNDLNLKLELNKAFPNMEYSYNKETTAEYSEKLYNSLEIMKYYITNILISFNYNQYLEFVNNMFEEYNQKLINCGFDFYKLSDFYNKNIGSINSELNYELNTTSFGYSIQDPSYLLTKAKTINEMLHILHHVIVNNENFYKDIPILDEKNNENQNVILYGVENKIATEIYNQIPTTLESDKIDILSLNNKIVIMARDLGHALSVEIDLNDKECFITYFIPKICNYEMVNELKGVNPVNKDSKFTTGMFSCEINKLPFEIANFMEKVPTDYDMIFQSRTL